MQAMEELKGSHFAVILFFLLSLLCFKRSGICFAPWASIFFRQTRSTLY